MNNVAYSKTFIRKAKSLKKRHPSLINELEILEQSLLQTPKQGIDLGSGCIRLD